MSKFDGSTRQNVVVNSDGSHDEVVAQRTPLPLGFKVITSLDTAKGLVPPANARYALISVTGAPVRYRDDGTQPTASIGMPLQIGDLMKYDANLSSIFFIQQSSGASLEVAFYA